MGMKEMFEKKSRKTSEMSDIAKKYNDMENRIGLMRMEFYYNKENGNTGIHAMLSDPFGELMDMAKEGSDFDPEVRIKEMLKDATREVNEKLKEAFAEMQESIYGKEDAPSETKEFFQNVEYRYRGRS